MALAMQQGSEADMADFYDTQGVDAHEVHPDAPVATAGRVGTTLNILGAAASLALVVGVGVWGYKLLVRDVSGVPVVRALEGPMRVQPDNPGGQPADHQGLAVNTVAAEGSAAPTAQTLKLAPRAVQLADEDAPMGELAQLRPAVDAAVREAVAPDQTGDAAVAAFRAGSVDALVDQLTMDATPLGTSSDVPAPIAAVARVARPDPALLEEADSAPEATAETAPEVVTLDGPGLQSSLRPMLRPVKFETNSSFSEIKEEAAALDVDPDTLPVGTKLAQLGAYESPEVARSEWDRLNAKFGDYLDGKNRVIQKASSGGRTFYRLRAMGFSDLSDARRFCSALAAENADCIPVTLR
jgi:hypothetical protein